MRNLKINEDFKIVENFDDWETPLMICNCEDGYYLCYEDGGSFYDDIPDYYESIEDLILDYYSLKFFLPIDSVEKKEFLKIIQEVNFWDY